MMAVCLFLFILLNVQLVCLPDLMDSLSSSFLCTTLLPLSLAQLGPIMCQDTKVRALGSYREAALSHYVM